MHILVSGAGMAGLSAAIGLGATGHDVTLVELAKTLRSGGSPIDIRGEALQIAHQMGVLEQIRENRVTMTERSQFVDAQGTVLAELPADEVSDVGDGVDVSFVSGRHDRFDLVVGADGVHSLTRRLVFGPEQDYLHHLGLYIALTKMPTTHRLTSSAAAERVNPILNWPAT